MAPPAGISQSPWLETRRPGPGTGRATHPRRWRKAPLPIAELQPRTLAGPRSGSGFQPHNAASLSAPRVTPVVLHFHTVVYHDILDFDPALVLSGEAKVFATGRPARGFACRAGVGARGPQRRRSARKGAIRGWEFIGKALMRDRCSCRMMLDRAATRPEVAPQAPSPGALRGVGSALRSTERCMREARILAKVGSIRRRRGVHREAAPSGQFRLAQKICNPYIGRLPRLVVSASCCLLHLVARRRVG